MCVVCWDSSCNISSDLRRVWPIHLPRLCRISSYTGFWLVHFQTIQQNVVKFKSSGSIIASQKFIRLNIPEWGTCCVFANPTIILRICVVISGTTAVRSTSTKVQSSTGSHCLNTTTSVILTSRAFSRQWRHHQPQLVVSRWVDRMAEQRDYITTTVALFGF